MKNKIEVLGRDLKGSIMKEFKETSKEVEGKLKKCD